MGESMLRPWHFKKFSLVSKQAEFCNNSFKLTLYLFGIIMIYNNITKICPLFQPFYDKESCLFENETIYFAL